MKKILFKLKKKTLKKKLFKFYWLLFKYTRNNLFAYIFHKYTGKLKCYISLGLAGYKGPAKKSDIAYFEAGRLLREKLLLLKIKNIDILFTSRIRRKIKTFLRGFKPTLGSYYTKYFSKGTKNIKNINSKKEYFIKLKKKIERFYKKNLINIRRIYVMIKIAHNGCRPKKKRRV